MTRKTGIKAAVEFIEAQCAEGVISESEADGRLYLRGPVMWDVSGLTRPWAESDSAQLRMLLQGVGPFQRADVADALAIVGARNRWNPVRDRLRQLPSPTKEVTPEELFYEALAVDTEDVYVGMAVDLLVKGLVARAMQPGIQFDYLGILRGPQGCGKSSFLRAIALEPEFFTDAADLAGDEAKFEQSVRGRWVVECSELNGVKASKKLEQVKRIISRTSFQQRRLYSQFLDDWPRTCVLFATSNGSPIPHDPSGGRRFIALECHGERNVRRFDPEGIRRRAEMMFARLVEKWDAAQAGRGEFDLTLPAGQRFQNEAQEARARMEVPDLLDITVHTYLSKVVAEGSSPNGVPPRVNLPRICQEAFQWSPADQVRFRGEVARIVDALDNADGWVRLTKPTRVGDYGISRRTWEWHGPYAVRPASPADWRLEAEE